MALQVVGATPSYLSIASTAVTAIPFSVGMWARMDAVSAGNQILWGLSDTATTNNYWVLRLSNAETATFASAGGATEVTVSSAGAMPAGRWFFILARAVTNANRWITNIAPTGAITSAQSSTNAVPTGIDTRTVGALLTSGGTSAVGWTGAIAEYWMAAIDVGLDPATSVPAPLLRQLAYGGPFSVNRIWPRLVEYRSYRKHPLIGETSDVFNGIFGAQNWSMTNTPTIKDQPPLPYWYEKPTQSKIILPI